MKTRFAGVDLAALLPKRPHLSRGHHKAMPFAEIPAFMCRLQAVEGMAARALEFAILTAARNRAPVGARWTKSTWRARCGHYQRTA